MERTRPMAPRMGRARRGFAVLAAMALAMASVGLIAPVAVAQGDLTISVGVGRSTEAGNAYLPGDVTVGVGDSITFVLDSDQPHTVTIGEGPADAPPFAWPAAGFDGSDPAAGLGTASTDGSGFVNTGLMFGIGSAATIEFTAAGQVPIFCTIHPGMEMNVTVVDDGPTTTQAEADAAGASSRQLIVDSFGPTREALLSEVSSRENDDGSTTWNVFANGDTPTTDLPGGGTGYAELLEYVPDTFEIAAGDTVSWSATRAHTVTFVPTGSDIRDVFPGAGAAFAPSGGTTFDGSEAVNSGFFATPGPDGPGFTDFALTFPEPGVYDYFCAIHAELGHSGTIIVS